MTDTAIRGARSARKAKGEGGQRRAEILAAAERIFVAEGYDRATIRRIADEVGLSSTALYMHFRDKGEILLEIGRQAIASLLAMTTEIGARPLDPAQRVRLMLHAYLDFALANPSTYQLVFCSDERTAMGARAGDPHAPVPGAEEEAEVARLARLNFERFGREVEALAAAGRLKRGCPAAAAQLLWAGCHGLAALLILRPQFGWSAEEALCAGMVDSLMEGLVSPPV